MNDEQREDLQRRFDRAGIPQLTRVHILNRAREQAAQERGVYRLALAELRAYQDGVQGLLPWPDPRRGCKRNDD